MLYFNASLKCFFNNLFICRGSEHPTYLHIEAKKGVVAEQRPIVNFTHCETLVKSYVAHKVYKPKELVQHEINAFSYYFDRATEVGLIGEQIFHLENTAQKQDYM
jgi:hypothetical protein